MKSFPRIILKARKYFELFILFFFISNFNSFAQDNDVDKDISRAQLSIAPVTIDGIVLFHVRGVSTYPAKLRAESIERRIEKIAANYLISPDSVKAVPGPERYQIFAGTFNIMNVYDADGTLEELDAKLLVEIYVIKIRLAITNYREERTKPMLSKGAIRAAIALAVMLFVLFISLLLIKRIDKSVQARIKSRIESLESKSFNLIKSNHLWTLMHIFFRTVRVIVIVGVLIFFTQYVLGQFPWTRGAGNFLLNIFMSPLIYFEQGFINFLPSLAFLIVIFFITRYFLKVTRLLFVGLSQGEFKIENFEADWAMPTFKIIRIAIIAFAVVIAYPYIPGSETSAFKGVSVFFGVLLSLGSSSFIGNVIAGYSMTYRSAYKVGDRIQFDNTMGFVEEQKLLVTRLRSVKNEELIIPNSILLNSNIVNYNKRANDLGIILHTIVGIGYETPWRQVETMLKLAADRTEGILKDPPPYVLQKSLDDFAVKYEINGYCKDVQNMYLIYTELHRNILDIFNENNVQIMTPAYEGDPETQKVVPKDKWDTPLANH